jgi:quinol-cytochrome oxidoreductase complex cytochrome b subunit
VNKVFGVLLILVSIVLGLLGALQLLAGVENLIGESFDAVYLLKRVAIAFIALFFMYKAFCAGKKKFSKND